MALGIVVSAELARKIDQFLTQKHTGQIILHINEGRIEGYDLRDMGRLRHSAERATMTLMTDGGA